MQFHPTTLVELERYFRFSRQAQAQLRARGLLQYVPAADPGYHNGFREKQRAGIMWSVVAGDDLLACFALTETHPPYDWPNEANALYISGIVVDPAHHHRGVGAHILAFAAAQTELRRRCFLHLTCEMTNQWLNVYYRRAGFVPVGDVETYPGYIETMYERRCVAPGYGSPLGAIG